MKKILTTILILSFVWCVSYPTTIFATNTNSIDFEKNNSQYLSITDAAQTGLDFAGDFTIEFWLNIEQLGSTPPTVRFHLVDKQDGGTTPAGYNVNMSHLSYINIELYSSAWPGGYTFAYETTPLNAGDVGVWKHFAIVVDAGSPAVVTFYVNGSVGTTAYDTQNATGAAANALALNIGWETGTTMYADAKMDDIRMWSDIRTAQEIADNYQTELVGNEANLVGYWKLNGNANDETSNNNDLTENNTPTYSTDIPFGGGGGDSGWEFYDVD